MARLLCPVSCCTLLLVLSFGLDLLFFLCWRQQSTQSAAPCCHCLRAARTFVSVEMDADSPLVHMDEVEEQGWSWKLIRTFSIVVLTITLGAVVWVSYLPIVPTIDEEFEAAPIETSLSIALFTLCNGVLPLVWGPISDNYSRRQLVLWAFPLLVVATYLGAIARSMLFMALVRMLSAIPSSVFYVVGMGILSDVVPPKNRALAFVRVANAVRGSTWWFAAAQRYQHCNTSCRG